MSEDLFVLEDWISGKRVDAIKRVQGEDHLKPKMKQLVDEVVVKVDETVAAQKEVEEKLKEKFEERRAERQEEIHIITDFEKHVTDKAEEKPYKVLLKCMVYMQRVYREYRDYDRMKKKYENQFVDKLFKNRFFCNKLRRVNNGIKDVVKLAEKDPKKQTDRKVDSLYRKTQRKVIKPLELVLNPSERNFLLSQLSDTREKRYRKFLDKQKVTLKKVEELLA